MSSTPISARPLPILDAFGVGLSGLCLVHCFGAALVFGLLGGAQWLPLWHSEYVHVALLCVAGPLALRALVQGYRTHGRGTMLILGIVGLKLMALALVFHQDMRLENSLTALGAALLAIAHVQNFLAHRAAREAQ